MPLILNKHKTEHKMGFVYIRLNHPSASFWAYEKELTIKGIVHPKII